MKVLHPRFRVYRGRVRHGSRCFFLRVLEFNEKDLRGAIGLPSAKGNPKRPTPLSRTTAEEINYCGMSRTITRSSVSRSFQRKKMFLVVAGAESIALHQRPQQRCNGGALWHIGGIRAHTEAISTMIGKYHNSRLRHLGVGITLKRLQQDNVSFPKMKSLVRQF